MAKTSELSHDVHLFAPDKDINIRISLVVAISPKESLGTSVLGSDQHLVEHLLDVTADSDCSLSEIKEHSWQRLKVQRPFVQLRI